MADEEDKVEETDESSAEAGEESSAEAEEESSAEAGEESSAEDSTDVKDVELPEGQDTSGGAAGGQIDILLDTTMPVEIHLGEVELEVRELLKLAPGAVVTLERQVGEPLDLYLKGIWFARGQLVVVGDQLGVRLTEILPSASIGASPDQSAA